MKFVKIRIFIRDLMSVLKGWSKKYTNTKLSEEVFNNWHCVASFSTHIKERKEFEELNYNRFNNMKLCCELIDRTVFLPGEIFSFRKVIGEVTEKKGFKEGPMLIKGKLYFTIGGGLCQISSTLFNAALMANLEILEKHNHSVDIWGDERFIDLGRDAVYVYALKDLIFRNTLSEGIVLRMKVNEKDNMVNCNIFSVKQLPYKVYVESSILKEIVPANSLHFSKKEKQIKGWIVETMRYIEQNNISRITYQRKDIYKPLLFKE